MSAIQHPFPPLFDAQSEILILGSFPSVKSREQQFFYGHPQNRFWRVTAAVCGAEVPVTIEEKRAFLLRNHIALWDVIASCEITGSSDSSIRNVVPNDLTPIFKTAQIRQIYVNGGTAAKYYDKYQKPVLQRDAIRLPSTSPANAAWSVERLVSVWQCIRQGMCNHE
ncbi:MAG: DNA-deoxyinosine glycosylase [Oscillospiraceae bacterium]|nr:DNA-deoxyinosine glycosylase [Oscillospiraceae bacterium]